MGTTKHAKGFTLIEIIVVLGVIMILAGVLAPFLFRILERTATSAATQDLDNLKLAMIGDASKKDRGVRTDYGYVGDMGILPGFKKNSLLGADKLKELVVIDPQSPQPTFKFVSDVAIGGGYQGPYVALGAADGTPEQKVTLDPFATKYVYEVFDPEAVTSPDGVVARIVSSGSNGTPGDSDDLKVEILKRDAFGTVFGQVLIQKEGGGLKDVPVTIYFPDASVPPANGSIIVSETKLTDAKGNYEFADIPFGVRSLRVDPKVVLAKDSAVAKKDDDDDDDDGDDDDKHVREKIEFKITNLSANDVFIKEMKVTYTTTPAAYYSEVKLGGTTVFKFDDKKNCPSLSSRKKSGDLVVVSPTVKVPKRGTSISPVVFHVDQPRVRAPDLFLADEGGETLKAEIKHFRDNP